MFYDRFVQLCLRTGVSPSRAAVSAGLSKSTVTRWKQNPDIVPSGAVLETLSQYFKVPISEIIGDEQKETPMPVDMSDVDLAFYGEYRELSDDDQATIRDMVRVMRERRK